MIATKETCSDLIDTILSLTKKYEEVRDQEEKQRIVLNVLQEIRFLYNFLTAPVWRDGYKPFRPAIGETGITAEWHRDFVADILQRDLPLTHEMRFSLVYGLRALNTGEIFPLFSPTKSSNMNKKYTIAAWQMMALLHVERMVARGKKRGAAMNEVASAYGYEERGETVKKWKTRDILTVFDEEWVKGFCNFVKRVRPLAAKHTLPTDHEERVLVIYYRALFDKRNNLSECGRNYWLAKNGKNAPLPHFLFYSMYRMDQAVDL